MDKSKLITDQTHCLYNSNIFYIPCISISLRCEEAISGSAASQTRRIYVYRSNPLITRFLNF
jgi:hypothetical protein